MKDLVVDGQLPGRRFGRNLEHTIKPVVTSVPTDVGSDEDDADALRDKIQARVNAVRDDIVQTKETFSVKQSASLIWLLWHAEAEMGVVFQIFDKWRYRDGGSFSLELGDKLADFPPGQCEVYGEEVEIQASVTLLGQEVKSAVFRTCPTLFELEERPLDRQLIRARFSDALKHVRCAEYGLWKLRLVARAHDIAGTAELGLAGVPATGQAKIEYEALQWADGFLPDPDELPPPEDVPPGLPPPEGEGAPLVPDEPPAPTKPSGARAAFLAVSGVALGVLLWKGMK